MPLTNIRVNIKEDQKSIKDIYNKVRYELRKHDRHDLKNRLVKEWNNVSTDQEKIQKLKEYVRLNEVHS